MSAMWDAERGWHDGPPMRATLDERGRFTWRAFYGDPTLSDEQRDIADLLGVEPEQVEIVPEMSGMDLYREHTGHGICPVSAPVAWQSIPCQRPAGHSGHHKGEGLIWAGEGS